MTFFPEPSSSYVISLKAFNNVGEGRPIYETAGTREEIGEFCVPCVTCAVVIAIKQSRKFWKI